MTLAVKGEGSPNADSAVNFSCKGQYSANTGGGDGELCTTLKGVTGVNASNFN